MKISRTGYKKNSKDKNEKSLLIPSNHISMHGVNHPVFGMDNLGNHMMMHPGAEYMFPGHHVMEMPIKQMGGASKKLKLPKKDEEDMPMDDESIAEQNKKYFIQRVTELGPEEAIKEYSKHFGLGKKRKYSIKKK